MGRRNARAMTEDKTRPRIAIPDQPLAAFCRRWKIGELAFFGSVLRDDFGPESDVDVLATFVVDANWSHLDHPHMEAELARRLGRKVDVVDRRVIEKSENWIRRRSILESAQPYYVAR